MTHCSTIPYMERGSKFNLQCNTGVLNVDAIDQKTETELFQVGIINKSQELTNYCSNSAFSDPFKCSSYVNADAVMEQVHTQCHGKSSCQIENPVQFVN